MMAEVRLGGETRDMSVLIARLPAFYSMVQGKSPQDSADFLNQYCFPTIVPSILNHHGGVDQYVGVIVVARFGAPIPRPEHRIDAVAAALEIRQVMEAASLPFTLTVSSGLAFVGNIGIEDRLQYTVVGEMVDRAFRMSERQKPGTIVIMGQQINEDKIVLDLLRKVPYLLSMRPLRSNLGPTYQIIVPQEEAVATS